MARGELRANEDELEALRQANPEYIAYVVTMPCAQWLAKKHYPEPHIETMEELRAECDAFMQAQREAVKTDQQRKDEEAARVRAEKVMGEERNQAQKAVIANANAAWRNAIADRTRCADYWFKEENKLKEAKKESLAQWNAYVIAMLEAYRLAKQNGK